MLLDVEGLHEAEKRGQAVAVRGAVVHEDDAGLGTQAGFEACGDRIALARGFRPAELDDAPGDLGAAFFLCLSLQCLQSQTRSGSPDRGRIAVNDDRAALRTGAEADHAHARSSCIGQCGAEIRTIDGIEQNGGRFALHGRHELRDLAAAAAFGVFTGDFQAGLAAGEQMEQGALILLEGVRALRLQQDDFGQLFGIVRGLAHALNQLRRRPEASLRRGGILRLPAIVLMLGKGIARGRILRSARGEQQEQRCEKAGAEQGQAHEGGEVGCAGVLP